MGEMMRAIEEVLLASVSGKQTSRNVVGGESKMRMKGKRKAASEEMIWGPRVRTGIKVRRDACFKREGELTVC